MSIVIATDELAFIEAICREPADDTVRLAYADWLDERPGPRVPCPKCKGTGGRVVDGSAWDRFTCAGCGGAGDVVDSSNSDRAEFIRVQVADPVPPGSEPGAYPERQRRLWAEVYSRDLKALGNWWGLFGNGVDRYSRGFVSAVTCTAAAWIAHADAICWHPGQKCPKCHGTRLNDIGHSDGPVPCMFCPDGTRPCPPTAQPVTRVTLTGTPEGHWIEEGGETVFWFTRGTTVVRSVRERDVSARRLLKGDRRSTPHTMIDVLETAWERITFTLPPEPV